MGLIAGAAIVLGLLIVVAVLMNRHDKNKMLTARGLWTKKYTGPMMVNIDAPKMQANGWRMVSQSSQRQGNRDYIIVTWQR